MNRLLKISAVILASTLVTGCFTRVETGKVGLRVNASKEIQGTELMPGSWNQTLVGDVILFNTKDIAINIDNARPLTSDNTPMGEFDLTVVYGINPNSVAEVFSKKSKNFHAVDSDGDISLMYARMTTLVNNAAQKAVRQFKSLEVGDNRTKIEEDIRSFVNDQLKEDKLDDALTLTDVTIKAAVPNKEILESATEYVKSQNALKIKENEVILAKREAERMSALAQNSQQSIAYMNALANMKIAEAVLAGKVNTMIIPSNSTPMINVKN